MGTDKAGSAPRGGGRARQSTSSASVSICQRHSPAPEPGKQPEQGGWEGPSLPCLSPCSVEARGRGPVLESEDNTGLVPTPPPEN